MEGALCHTTSLKELFDKLLNPSLVVEWSSMRIFVSVTNLFFTVSLHICLWKNKINKYFDDFRNYHVLWEKKRKLPNVILIVLIDNFAP